MIRTCILLVSSTFFLFGGAANAQHDDIAVRSIAMDACQVEGFGGYGSYETCVEAVYSEAIEAGRYRFKNINAIDPNTPAFQQPLMCFSRTEGDYCIVE